MLPEVALDSEVLATVGPVAHVLPVGLARTTRGGDFVLGHFGLPGSEAQLSGVPGVLRSWRPRMTFIK